MDNILNAFLEYPIDKNEARRAAEIFALAKKHGLFRANEDKDKGLFSSSNKCPKCNRPYEEPLLKKYAFDLFHCACADVNGLRLESKDSDISKIQQLIKERPQHAQA
jgi:predicted nucleic acid-binding protein